MSIFTPVPIGNPTQTLVSSTGVSNLPLHVPVHVPRENRRIRSIQRDKKTYPSPPPSPAGSKRTCLESGLDPRYPSQAPLKKRCSRLSEDLQSPGNTLRLNYPLSCDMAADRQLQNGNASTGNPRPPAAYRNDLEQVRNVCSRSIAINTAMLPGNGCSSHSEVKLCPQTSSTPTPKKRRYFDVDPKTGEERITEIMEQPPSAKGGSEKRVYALPSFASFGHSHSKSGSHQIEISSSPQKFKSPLGTHEGSPLLPPAPPVGTPLGQPGPVLDKMENICESPVPMSRAGSVAMPSGTEENKSNEAEGHCAITIARGQPSLAHTVSSASSTEGSPTCIACATGLFKTQLATSPLVRSGCETAHNRPVPGVEELTILNAFPAASEPLGISRASATNIVTAQPLAEERVLNEVSNLTSVPEAKRRREPPPALSLADNVGNFATLASSRERRQPTHSTTKEPVPSTPVKTPITKSGPVTPTRSHSRKNSNASNTVRSSSPEMLPLSPILPPSSDCLQQVPSDVSERMIANHVSLYAMRNGGELPPQEKPRPKIKGTYRSAMQTDKPDVEDFIVVGYAEATYWDVEMQSEEEDSDSSSTDVERWSGGNVKGPKFKSRMKQKRKLGRVGDVGTGTPNTPNNVPNARPTKKPTSKVKPDGTTVQVSSTGKEKNLGNSTGGGLLDLGARTKAARKLSTVIVEDEGLLVDDPMDLDYGQRLGPSSSSRPGSRGGVLPTASIRGQLSTGRPQRMSAKHRISAREMSTMEIPMVTASSPYHLISDTEISSDDDVIPAKSAFGYGTAPASLRQRSLASQTREQRKQDRFDTVRFTESGPNGKGLVPGSTSIFSIAQLAIPGQSVMGPAAAKVSPAEYKLYIGRRGDQVPLFGSGGNMVVPGLGSIGESMVIGGDSMHGGSSLFQPGGIVEVRRVEDPLLEATMEIKRLIYENGHQGGLAPASGVLGGLSVEKVYWSGEREASLTKPLFGLGVDFSGRPLVKAVTFSNPLTNHTYTLLFVWAFLPVNTPEKNKENAVGNSMLLSDEVKGEGASSIHSDDVRASFQVHLCVGKPGRVQKKEERKRLVFVQFPNAGKGGKSSKTTSANLALAEAIRWERWELDGLMRGLTRLWLERTKSRRGSSDTGLPRILKRSITVNGPICADSLETGDSIGNWLEREVLGLGLGRPNMSLSTTPLPKKAKIHPDQNIKVPRSISLPSTSTSSSTIRVATVQTMLPMYMQGVSSATGLPPPPSLPFSPIKRSLSSSITSADSEAIRRGEHRRNILMKELTDVLPEVRDAIIPNEEDSETEVVYWL